MKLFSRILAWVLVFGIVGLSIVSPDYRVIGTLLEAIDLLESDVAFRNLSPKCEPQLGRRGLLPAASESEQMALLWMLNLCDGNNSLLDIAERAGLPFGELRRATEILIEQGLLEECGSSAGEGARPTGERFSLPLPGRECPKDQSF
jgi:hypothetical protein